MYENPGGGARSPLPMPMIILYIFYHRHTVFSRKITTWEIVLACCFVLLFL